MLAAQDKDQVRKWSERQLGRKARLVSIFEEGSSNLVEAVEKGGTGIQAKTAAGCQPVLSIMANFTTKLHDAKESHMDSDDYTDSSRPKGRKPTVH